MNTAIIVGAGSGKRMNSKLNKVFLTLIDKPIIQHTIEKFEACKEIEKIILVTKKEDIGFLKQLVKNNNYKKIQEIIGGGSTRQESVQNGFKAIKDPISDDIITIHNAANPFITQNLLTDCINAAFEYGASIAATKTQDTIKQSNLYNSVEKTLDRSNLWQAQTPQCFKYYILKEAFENKDETATDEAMLIENLGKDVKIVECNKENFKITTENDLIHANQLHGNSRIGIGQDSHIFTKEKKDLVLGGIIIPNHKGLEANSDGDVILHSLFNALSTAIGGKSIGNYADVLCKEKGIKDSSRYLKIPLKNIQNKELEINNIAIHLECKTPNLRDYEQPIIDNIAQICKIDNSKVGLAVTSGENLTSFGKGIGIQCFVLATLIRK